MRTPLSSGLGSTRIMKVEGKGDLSRYGREEVTDPNAMQATDRVGYGNAACMA